MPPSALTGMPALLGPLTDHWGEEWVGWDGADLSSYSASLFVGVTSFQGTSVQFIYLLCDNPDLVPTLYTKAHLLFRGDIASLCLLRPSGAENGVGWVMTWVWRVPGAIKQLGLGHFSRTCPSQSSSFRPQNLQMTGRRKKTGIAVQVHFEGHFGAGYINSYLTHTVARV